MRRVLAFTAAVFVFLPLSLAGQRGSGAATPQRPATAPAPSRGTPLAEAPPLTSKVLPNGLEVVVFEDHSVPLVTVELAVRNGSFTETPELNGLSHLFEHMFFKTNEAILRREDYLKDFDQLGISYNGTTREEVVEYYFTTIAPNFPIAMRYIRDAVRYPLFDEREFAAEKEVVMGELRNHESNPFLALDKEMTARLFFKYPSRKRPGGSLETVRAATTTMMRTIGQRYYVPNNSAIVVSGDVSPQAAFQVAENLFSEWPKRTPDPFVEFPLVEHPPLPESQAAIITQPVQNVVIEFGWHGPSIGKDDAATYAADVFSYILEQPDSRFQRALVDSELALQASIGYYTQRNVGPISVLIQTQPDKAKAAVKAAYAEIARFADPTYYTDQELENAKAALEVNDLFSREKPSEYTHTIGFWWASTGLDYFRGYLKRLRDTSRADITRYVTTYIQNKPHVTLALQSDAAARISGLTTADLLGKSSGGDR